MDRYYVDDEYCGLIYDKETNTYLGYEVSCELLNEKEQKITDLEAKLAEKEKEIESLRESNNYLDRQLDYFTNKFRSRDFKRTGNWQKDVEIYMNQTAIAELEKVKTLIQNAVNFETPDLVGLYDAVDQQIKSLKGENL